MKKIKISVFLILLLFFSEVFANQVNQYTNIYNRSIGQNCLKIFENPNTICSCVKDKWIGHLKKSTDRYDFDRLAQHYNRAANGLLPRGPSKQECQSPPSGSELSRQCSNQALEPLGKIIVTKPFTVDGITYKANEPVSIRAYFKHKWGPGFRMKWLAYKERVKVTSFDESILFDCQYLEVKKNNGHIEKNENKSCLRGHPGCDKERSATAQ